MMRWNLAFPLVLLMLISGIQSVPISGRPLPSISDIPLGHTSHSPIDIQGNSDLQATVSSEGWNGTGTEEDPFIVEGLYIDGGSTGYCFKLFNVTSHLKIINCTFENCTKTGNGRPGNGLWVSNSTNLTLRNVNTMDCYVGLYFEDCSHLEIQYANTGLNTDGAEFLSSENITIDNSRFHNNSRYGIRSTYGDNMTLSDSWIKNNVNNPVRITSAGRITFEKCDFLYNSNSVRIYDGNRVHIEECNLRTYGQIALELIRSVDFSMTDTSVFGPLGMYSAFSSRINLDGNVFRSQSPYNTYGVSLLDSSRINVTHTHFDLLNYGLYLINSQNANIINPSFEYVTIAFSFNGASNVNISDISQFFDVDGVFDFRNSNDIRVVNVTGDSLDFFVNLNDCSAITFEEIKGTSQKFGATIIGSSDVTFIDSSLNSVSECFNFYDSSGLEIHGCDFSSEEWRALIIQGYSRDCNVTMTELHSDFLSSFVVGEFTTDSTFRDIDMTGYGFEIRFVTYTDYSDIWCMETCSFENISLNEKKVAIIADRDMNGGYLEAGFRQAVLYNVSNFNLNGQDMGSSSSPLQLFSCQNINLKEITLDDYLENAINVFNCNDIEIYGIDTTSENADFLTIQTSENVSLMESEISFVEVCVQVFDSKGIIISNNTFRRSSISVQISYNSEVYMNSNDHLSISFSGIFVDSSTLMADGDRFISSDNGIRITSQKPVQVRNCYFGTILSYGISLNGGNRENWIRNSTFEECGYGIALTINDPLTISGCKFTMCNTGVYAASTSDMIVNRSIFISNGKGIHARSVEGSYIIGNLFYDNNNQAILLEDCEDNRIYGNSFIRNSGVADNYNPTNTQCIDHDSHNDWFDPDTHRGNHWSEWTDPDDDLDGIVDSSYDLVGEGGQASDRYPLVFSPVKLIDPPLNLRATPGSNTIDLFWSRPPEPELGYITGYRIYRGVNHYEMSMISMVDDTNLLYFDRNLEVGRTYYYQVRAISTIGVGDPTPALSVTTDATPPVIRITNPMDGSAHSSHNLTVRWNVYDHETDIAGMKISIDEGPMIDLGLNDSFDIGYMEEGSHFIRLQATNTNGLTEMDSVDFIIDTTPPVLEWSDISDPVYFRTSSINLQFAAEDSNSGVASVHYRIDSGAWLSAGPIDVISTQLTEGRHFLELLCQDRAGNQNIISLNVTVDRSDPVVEITSPIEDQFFTSSNVTVRLKLTDEGTGIDRVQYSLDGGPFTDAGLTDQFEIQGLDDGRYSLRVRVYDLAGNHDEGIVNFIIDSIGPEVISFSPVGDRVGLRPTLEVFFSKEMDPDSLQIEFDGLGVDNWYGDTLFFTLTKDLLPNTRYDVLIRCTDLAGNGPVDVAWSFNTTNSGIIHGKVIDGSGNPIRGAMISILGSDPVVTGSDGEFRMEASMGNVILTITADGMKSREMSVRVLPDKEVGIVLVELEEEEDRSNDLDFIPLVIIAGGIVMIMVLIVGLVIARRMNRNDFEFYIDEEATPQTTTRGYARMKNDTDFEDFWLDTGEEMLSDHYQVLGIPRNSTDPEIRRAYRRMAARYHPDRAHLMDHQERLENQEMMAHINEAKTVLLNPLHRTHYDAWLYDRDLNME